ncbi:MAG TPA: cobalamin-binding protein [Pyrinomonadaceae bacterium]|nr:cobalamin-binding protein [Pyrinomonadaceae bacterium]
MNKIMPSSLQIVSFLPSATELACALGLTDQLVGITHECDYPPEIKGKPIVVRAALPIETMTQPEIDVAVSERMRNGQSLYEVDEKLLQALAPNLIITQDLCQVCAPSGNEVSQALRLLPKKPQILWLTPNSLDQIFENLRDLGEATGTLTRAQDLIAEGRARLQKVEDVTNGLSSRPRVFCMEWLDPVYCSGHWVPEMVRIAGGVDGLGQEGSDSIRITWEDVLEWRPEVLIITPCGYDLEKTVEVSGKLPGYAGWAHLPAVRDGRVFAVDANSYFARPGPRVIEGTELLAHLIHPETFSWEGPATAFCRLEF